MKKVLKVVDAFLAKRISVSGAYQGVGGRQRVHSLS